MISNRRFTPRDAVACIPVLCFAALMFFVWLAYREVGHWPVYSRPDPKDVGFEVAVGVRLGEILRFLLPLIAAPLSVVATIGVCLSTLNDLVDSKRGASFRRVAIRGICQITLSVVGLLLFWHVLGTLLDWLID